MILLACSKIDFILNVVVYLFKFVGYIIPVFLIILITFDFVKAMISGDEKASKEASGKALKRFIYAIIFFLIPALVRIIFGIIAEAVPSEELKSWNKCYESAWNNK